MRTSGWTLKPKARQGRFPVFELFRITIEACCIVLIVRQHFELRYWRRRANRLAWLADQRLRRAGM